MRTISEIISGMTPGETLDLNGEHITGSKVHNIPANISLYNANLHGMATFYSPVGVTISGWDCSDPGDEPIKGLLVMLGGDGWTIDDCSLVGGRCAGQLSVGLDMNQPAEKRVPRNWIIKNCDASGNGLWGVYPQAHAVYCLADPNTHQNGLIEDCFFSQPGVGATVKIGGTGNFPRTEGSKGITVQNCHIEAGFGPDGRAQVILTQGSLTSATFRNCELSTIGEIPTTKYPGPMITVADGAWTQMFDIPIVRQMFEDVRWYEMWGLWSRRWAGPAPKNVGNLRWYFK